MNKPRARSGHVSVLVGRYIVVFGGYSEDFSNMSHYHSVDEIWVYHLDLKQWFVKDTGGEIPPNNSGARAEVLDGKLYLIGGHTLNGNINETYSLDLNTWTWSHLQFLDDLHKFSPKDKFVSWTYQNCIYIFGGFGYGVHSYMPCQGEYVPDPSTLSERGWNNQLHKFNADKATWSSPTTKGVAPSPRAAHAAACLSENAYIFGGRHNTERLNDLHCLHLPTMTWSGKLGMNGPVPQGRSWHSLSPVSDKVLFMYGGFSQDEDPLGDGWLLDVDELQWTQLHHLPMKPRLWHTACHTSHGDVYVFGGCINNILKENEGSEHSNDLLCFRFSPQCLVDLCMETVVEGGISMSQWPSLPRSLYNALNARFTAKTSELQSEHLSPDSQALICTLS